MTKISTTLATYRETETGIEVENFWDETNPQGQLVIAAQYVAAAFVLDENEGSGPLLHPKYMLACQAIELAQKSALLIAGSATAQELKRAPLNHDLARLLDRCEQIPEFTLEDRDAAVIRAVAPAMSAFSFRYGIEGGSISQPVKLHLPAPIFVIRAANNARAIAWRMLKLGDVPKGP